jgi:hypothetical protein
MLLQPKAKASCSLVPCCRGYVCQREQYAAACCCSSSGPGTVDKGTCCEPLLLCNSLQNSNNHFKWEVACNCFIGRLEWLFD